MIILSQHELNEKITEITSRYLKLFGNEPTENELVEELDKFPFSDYIVITD